MEWCAHTVAFGSELIESEASLSEAPLGFNVLQVQRKIGLVELLLFIIFCL